MESKTTTKEINICVYFFNFEISARNCFEKASSSQPLQRKAQVKMPMPAALK